MYRAWRMRHIVDRHAPNSHTCVECTGLLKNLFALSWAPRSGVKYAVLVVFRPCFSGSPAPPIGPTITYSTGRAVLRSPPSAGRRICVNLSEKERDSVRQSDPRFGTILSDVGSVKVIQHGSPRR